MSERTLLELLRDPMATDAGHWTGLSGLFDKAADRIVQLEAVVEKLPKTADGQPLVPCMDVWRITQSGCINEHFVAAVRPHAVGPNWLDINGDIHWGAIYSTRAAADAAQAAKATDTAEAAAEQAAKEGART